MSEQSRSGTGASAEGNNADDAADTRSPAEIEADIDAARERLAGTVDEIAERVKPANVAKKGKESAKAQVVDPTSGAVRVERVAIAGAIVVFYVALKVWRVRRDKRKDRKRH